MKLRFIYRTAGTGSPGGQISLADMEADDDDSTTSAPDKAEDKEEGEEGDDPDKKEEAPKETPDPEESEENDDKGGTENESTETVTDDSAEAEEFYAEVSKLRGGDDEDLDVDYGEVDPLSAEGVVIRERALEERAILNFEAALEQKYPKAYAFFLHTVAGKPAEDFFGSSKNLDEIPTEEQIEASVEVQKDMVLQNLLDKGNSEKHAQALIKLAIEDNELEEMAKTARTEKAARQEAELNKLKEENDRQLEIKNKQITKINTYIDQVVDSGQIGNIQIPVKDRKEFAKSLKESVRYDEKTGKLTMVTELSDESVTQEFAKEYFRFKGGDLKELVTAKAKTENVRRLKRTIKPDSNKSSQEPRSGKTSMLDIEAD